MKSTIDMIDVMEHFANGGEVEAKHRTYDADADWDTTPTPRWNWDSFDYRKKEPVKQKIKMLCYFNQEYEALEWIAERYPLVCASCIRQPHLDMEAEV